ncbi:MAG: SAM-dependent methyltransferase [Acidobacteria bacterium]|nr:SAM-dependent methyltransferase [Acidobacteriota bacterium]
MPKTPLKTLLVETLRRSGSMTFAEYMALCLYHPEHGYYTRGAERTGVRGDYFTSPDLHPVFARLLARQAAEMWELLERPEPFTWVEMGPGRGWFARDFLCRLREARPDFFAALRYLAIEPAPQPQARLRERLSEDGLADKVRVFSNLEEIESVTGCFFSNELVDAFPVSVVTRAGGRLKEIQVTIEADAFAEKPGPISDPAIAAAVARYANQLEEGHRVEVSLAAVRWIRSVAEKLVRGFVITIDYGDFAERLYTSDRPRGTLMAYRRHAATEDFYREPGEQDLTAHVNFSALVDAGKDVGLEFTGFTTQERLLMALGEENAFADLYDPELSEIEKLQARLKLKRLIHPEGMGGIFKVLIQHRGVAAPRLTGLKFTRS